MSNTTTESPAARLDDAELTTKEQAMTYMVHNHETRTSTPFNTALEAREFMASHYKADHYMDIVHIPSEGR